SSYPFSLYTIKELSNSFEVLCSMDVSTGQLREEYGTEQDWDFALSEISQYGSWMKYIVDVFGTTTNLEIAVGSWTSFDSRKKWLYFIALKLYGAKSSWCLSEATNIADSSALFIRGVFRSLLHLSQDDKDFCKHYDERKNIIRSLGNPDSEVADYCAMVKSKGEYTLYYLTDASKSEQNLIFENLATYSEKIGRSKVIKILEHVYPALYAYLQPYRFKISLLDSYFQEYKYQKVVNRVFPDFLQIVDEQAEKREFNLLLPARSAKLDAIEKNGTVVYFIDAMGVEYLSYIMDQCRLRRLMAYATLCHCELPSITSFNKEFVDAFIEGGAVFVPDKNGIKSLDDLKHHGEEEFDFTNNKLPTYISSELDIISKTIEKIATKLMKGTYKRAVIISDHGASRLSVLSKKENKWGSESNAEHSGRCCLISEIDEKPSCAIEENGYWVLANYDRFKGGRKANVEVHGGATLEEVVVPIIEIVYSPEEIEIQLLDKNIKFSRRKKDAVIRVFSKTTLDDLSVRISGLSDEYEGESSDGQTFTIALPELRKAGTYTVDVYYNNNPLKSGLKFTAENSDFSERKLL
ncbi:MAG: BREX-4 system phosphatase PglZ, partial [Fastidiosipila sp.]|nr:BREX-4 system phosphatase PglZ [Fastidiosipila sp.]